MVELVEYHQILQHEATLVKLLGQNALYTVFVNCNWQTGGAAHMFKTGGDYSHQTMTPRQLSGPALALQGHEVPGPAGPGLVGLAKSRGPAGPGSGRAREKSRP